MAIRHNSDAAIDFGSAVFRLNCFLIAAIAGSTALASTANQTRMNSFTRSTT